MCVRKINSFYVFSVGLSCSTFLYFFWDFVVVLVIEADALAHRVIDTRESVCVCVCVGGGDTPTYTWGKSEDTPNASCVHKG